MHLGPPTTLVLSLNFVVVPSCFPSAVDLPCSPLVGVAAETDVTARDADVLKIALMKSSDVPRVDFGWVAVLVGQFTIDDTR